jgi:hypothetical protein
MKRFYEEKYKFRNVITLVATFEDLPKPQVPTHQPLSKQDKIRLVLIGNFNNSNIEATQRFVNAVAQEKQYEVYMYTHVPTALLRLRGIDMSVIRHKGYISDSKLIDELQQYDIVILTHGFTGAYGEIEYKTIFPIRTISLLLSGKPMLVHSPPESFLSDFVREHDVGCLVDEPSASKIREGLDKIVHDATYANRIVDNAQRAAQMFYGPNVVSILRDTLGMAPGSGNKAAKQKQLA